jgi:hypothetical protein
MAFYRGPNTVTDGLVLALDAANTKSYVSGSTTAYSLVIRGSYSTPVSCSLVNGVSYSTNNAGYFILDGTNDQILIENRPDQPTGIRLNSNTLWMVNAWVRTAVAGSNGLGSFPVLSNRSGGPVASVLGIGAGGVMKYEHYSGSWLLETGSIQVNNNRWRMISWVNRSNNTLDMYVDGVFDRNVSSSISGNNPVDIIGASWAASSLNANIAYLTINIGPLFTQTQVQQNYNAQKSRFNL